MLQLVNLCLCQAAHAKGRFRIYPMEERKKEARKRVGSTTHIVEAEIKLSFIQVFLLLPRGLNKLFRPFASKYIHIYTRTHSPLASSQSVCVCARARRACNVGIYTMDRVSFPLLEKEQV